MMKTATPPPGAVFELAERAVDFVRRAVGIVLDYSADTLPVLDHYLLQVPAEQPATRRLVAAAAGAYFGEVARRSLGGHWEISAEPPEAWRVQLSGGVGLFPFALAVEAMDRAESDEVDALIDVPGNSQPAVEEVLARAGDVPVDEYYSLAGRLEFLTTVVELVATRSPAPD